MWNNEDLFIRGSYPELHLIGITKKSVYGWIDNSK